MTLSPQLVQRKLAEHTPEHMGEGAPESHAAVACILRNPEALEVLLIRRTEVPGDPWSGHMAFPGGRMEPGDPDLLATAVRETREEVGIDLETSAELLGHLDDLQAMAKGQPVDLIIRPFVFWLDHPSLLTPNDEVAEALWSPLDPLVQGKADTTRPYPFRGQTLDLPAYAVGPHIVWGLTYRMLRSLFALVGA